MRECILLFQFEPDRQRKLAAQLMLQKFRVKAVTQEEINQPVGRLAGDESIPEKEVSAEAAPSLDAPMLVMVGLTGGRVDAVIQAIKRAKIGKVPYKAVLTETNRHWSAGELLEELKKEHEMMEESDGQKKTHDVS